MIKSIFTIAAVIALTGCTGHAVDNAMISVEPTMNKYKIPGENANVGRFAYNNKTTADWQMAYENCAKTAGVQKNADLEVKNYGRATTINLKDETAVSNAQKIAIDACMHKFSASN